MTARPMVIDDSGTVTVRVPISIRRRGGRKIILAPNGSKTHRPAQRRRVDDALVKAIARAFRWREMLERGSHATITEIAAAERINQSYVCRILRLTLLAPEIIEAILNGRQPSGLQLPGLMRPFSVDWARQRVDFAMDIH